MALGLHYDYLLFARNCRMEWYVKNGNNTINLKGTIKALKRLASILVDGLVDNFKCNT